MRDQIEVTAYLICPLMQKPFELEAWTMHKPTISYYEIQSFYLLEERGSKDQTPDQLIIEALIPCK